MVAQSTPRIQQHFRQADCHRILEIHMYKEAGTSSHFPGVFRFCLQSEAETPYSPRLNPHRLRKHQHLKQMGCQMKQRGQCLVNLQKSTANVTNSLPLQYCKRLSRSPSTMSCSTKGTFSIFTCQARECEGLSFTNTQWLLF